MTILPIDENNIDKNDRLDNPEDNRKDLIPCRLEQSDEFMLYDPDNAGDAWIKCRKSYSTKPQL